MLVMDGCALSSWAEDAMDRRCCRAPQLLPGRPGQPRSPVCSGVVVVPWTWVEGEGRRVCVLTGVVDQESPGLTASFNRCMHAWSCAQLLPLPTIHHTDPSPVLLRQRMVPCLRSSLRIRFSGYGSVHSHRSAARNNARRWRMNGSVTPAFALQQNAAVSLATASRRPLAKPS